MKDLFREWLEQRYRLKAAHVMNLVQQMRGGKNYEAEFGARLRGRGEYADFTAQRFRLACRRYGYESGASEPDFSQFRIPGAEGQMSLL